MIDQTDQLTQPLPLIDAPVKRGRGRPPTGEAMTPAQKQKAYRERLKQRQHEAECKAAGTQHVAASNSKELKEMREKAIHFEAKSIALEKALEEARRTIDFERQMNLDLIAQLEKIKGNVTNQR